MKTLSPDTAAAAPYSEADIDYLVAKAFAGGRDPRSPAYRQGVRSFVALRLAGTPLPRLPYPLGTAEADAYFSGQAEGSLIARRETSGKSEKGGAS